MEIMRASLPSRFDAVSDCIQNAIESLKKKIPLAQQEEFDIKLVLEEAITNAIKHGNKFQEDLKVLVVISLNGHSLIIEVKDQGPGFDAKKVPDPTHKDGLTRTSGRGVFLMRKLMDEVQYLDNGRELKMIKILSGGGIK